MQTHECWSSPMWGHQITSLMTKRTIDLPEKRGPRDTTAMCQKAAEKRTEKGLMIRETALQFIAKKGCTTAIDLSREINRGLGWTRELLCLLETEGKIRHENEGTNTKFWRLV